MRRSAEPRRGRHRRRRKGPRESSWRDAGGVMEATSMVSRLVARGGRGVEQQIEHDALVGERKGAQGVRQRENQVPVRDGEQVPAPGLEPLRLLQALALRAVTVPARVVRDADPFTARATIDVPAQGRRCDSRRGVATPWPAGRRGDGRADRRPRAHGRCRRPRGEAAPRAGAPVFSRARGLRVSPAGRAACARARSGRS